MICVHTIFIWSKQLYALHEFAIFLQNKRTDEQQVQRNIKDRVENEAWHAQ